MSAYVYMFVAPGPRTHSWIGYTRNVAARLAQFNEGRAACPEPARPAAPNWRIVAALELVEPRAAVLSGRDLADWLKAAHKTPADRLVALAAAARDLDAPLVVDYDQVAQHEELRAAAVAYGPLQWNQRLPAPEFHRVGSTSFLKRDVVVTPSPPLPDVPSVLAASIDSNE